MAALAFLAGLTKVHLLAAVLLGTMEVQREHPLRKLARPSIDKQGLRAIFFAFSLLLSSQKGGSLHGALFLPGEGGHALLAHCITQIRAG